MPKKVRFEIDKRFLTRALPDMQKRAGMRQGALIRTIMRRSIRKRKKGINRTSLPFSRTGALRNFILFAWDEMTQSVVTGPLNLSRSIDDQLPTIDYGGQGEYVDRDGIKQTGRYRPRPFTQPALNTAESKLPELFKDTLK